MKLLSSTCTWLLLFVLMGVRLSSSEQREQAPLHRRLAAEIETLFATEFKETGSSGVVTSRVRQIYAEYGIPSEETVGEEAAAEYIVLVSGQPLTFIEEALPRVKRAAADGKISENLYIYLRARAQRKEIRRKFSGPPENPGLQLEVERLFRTDQSVRPAGNKPWDLKKLVETDRADGVTAREILAKYGLPTYTLVGPKAAGEFDTIIQHQPLDFQKQALPQMKAALNAGEVGPQSYAMLLDRVESSSGQPQTYGENFVCTADGKGKPSPIADPQQVDRRRAELGLMPLALYGKVLGELYMNNLCAQIAAANRNAAHNKTATPHE
jgi:hypothetical protein